MFANSFTIFSHPKELLNFMDKLNKANVGIINSAVFHSGFLTGGPKFDYRDVDPESEEGKRIHGWRDSFNKSCDEHGVLPGDACLHFGLSHPAIASVALNTSKPAKMNHNVEALQREIRPEFWEELKAKGLIDPEYQYL
jgi:D-threo-aldose 1-dehydrogenase